MDTSQRKPFNSRFRIITMAKYKIRNHHTYEDDGTTIKLTYQDILDKESTPNLAIPKDEANRHYQDYLAWVAEGNTADPAD